MKDKRPNCIKCKSTLVYIRLVDQERVCRTCGFIEKLIKAGAASHEASQNTE